MDFQFHCILIQHTNQRVTVLPLDLPQFDIHAPTEEKAREDLLLALDDKLSRMHPRLLGALPQHRPTQLIKLEPPVLPVWSSTGLQTHSFPLTAMRSKGHAGYAEIRIPRLGMRLWIEETADVVARATELVKELLGRKSTDELLDLRTEGHEQLLTLNVSATTTLLSSLNANQLMMDERPPPSIPGEEPEETPADTEAEDPVTDEDAPVDWLHPPPRRKRKPPSLATLNQLGDPLHILATQQALDRAYHVDPLVKELWKRMEQHRPEPVVLVGPPGVGKTAVVQELAHQLAHKDQPQPRRERPFFHVNGSRLIAGKGFFGDWQEQTFRVMEEARRSHAILHLGHIVDLLDAGKSLENDHNVAQVIAPILATQRVAVIGEATPEEWARIERTNQSFASVWSVLRVEEPSTELASAILGSVGGDLARTHDVQLRDDAIASALALSKRFWPYGSVIGNTVTFLRRLVTSCKHEGTRQIDRLNVVRIFSTESGVPEVLLRDDLPLPLSHVRDYLGARVLGQSAAVNRLSQVVTVIKAGLMDDRRPMAVLFFAGPTGVGKTELSKALAEFMFGSRDRMVRLDMGEYAGPDALSRLVGDHDSPGHLTTAVRRQPFSLVLLDEIEKAHSAVFDALLGVLGEGRLTDSQGAFTDFRNTIIIMTSNLGAETLRSRMGFSGNASAEDVSLHLHKHYKAEAEKFFRPELFNRLDDMVVFSPLDQAQLGLIIQRELDSMSRREGFKRHGVVVLPSDAARAHLLHVGHDPRYGARPLKRALERELVVPMGAYLSSHPGTRQTRITVDAQEGRLVLEGSGSDAHDPLVVKELVKEVLERGADLRSHARRLRRGRLASALQYRVAFHEKASREKGFWAEPALAEQKTAQANEAREILELLKSMETQAEAAEDLAFEAFYDRSHAAALQLGKELDVLDQRLMEASERLFATMFPPRGCTHLYLTAERGAWWSLQIMVKSYRDWCRDRSLPNTFYMLEDKDPNRKSRHVVNERYKWTTTQPEVGPMGPGGVISITGDRTRFLLAAEHGSHRFMEDGRTSLVRVKVHHATVHTISGLLDPDQLLDRMPVEEIRRVNVTKDTVKDFRTQIERNLHKGFLPLDTLFKHWLAYRINHPEAEPWN